METIGKRILKLKVNGTLWEAAVEPRATLLEVLREELGLTGAKEGCGLGGCGTCTVLMDGRPVRSCITPAFEAEGSDILTVEGLADLVPDRAENELHPIQEAFVENHGIQCGFCSPGMILSAKALLDENPSPTETEVRYALSGQSCRCTGYTKIVDSVLDASKRIRAGEARK